MDSGMVAELELVANSVMSAARVPLKKVIGLILPKNHNTSGNTTAPWKMVVPVDAKRVQVLTLHNCHPLWKTRTELAVIEVSK